MPPCAMPYALCLMQFLVDRVLTNDRHSIHDASEDQYMQRCNRRYNSDLLPRRNDVMQVIRQVPVEGHNGYVQSVHQNAEDGVKGAQPHNADASGLDAVAQNDGGKDYEAQQFNEEPIPVGRVQKRPIVVMGQGDHLQREVNVVPEHGPLAQSERQAVQAAEEPIVRPMAEIPGSERTHGDYHGERRVDARTQEQDGNVGRKPQRVELARREEEHGAERRLVQRREYDARDRHADGHHERPPEDPLRFEPLQDGRAEFEYLDREVGRNMPGHKKKDGG